MTDPGRYGLPLWPWLAVYVVTYPLAYLGIRSFVEAVTRRRRRRGSSGGGRPVATAALPLPAAEPVTPGRRVTLRGGWWVFGVVCGLTAAGCGLAGVVFGGVRPGGRLWTAPQVVAVGLLLLPGLTVVLRSPFVRVCVTRAGLVNHGLLRNRGLAWAQVTAVEVRPAPDLPTAFFPVLVLTDGSLFWLSSLGVYPSRAGVQRSRVLRQAAVIAATQAVYRAGEQR